MTSRVQTPAAFFGRLGRGLANAKSPPLASPCQRETGTGRPPRSRGWRKAKKLGSIVDHINLPTAGTRSIFSRWLASPSRFGAVPGPQG